MISKLRKISYFNLLPMIFITLIMYKIIFNTDSLINALNYIVSVLSYVIWAVSIAYILNPIMSYFEKKLKLTRGFSILIVYFLILLIIIFGAIFIIPNLVDSIGQLVSDLPEYISRTKNWVQKNFFESAKFSKYNITFLFGQSLEGILEQAKRILSMSLNFLDFSLGVIFRKTISVTSTLIKFVFGLILSVYILKDKENLLLRTKQILLALFKEQNAKRILSIGRKINLAFINYFISKLFDSIILGTICFIILEILNMRFALLISLIIGIANVIPYVGPITSTVICTLIMLLVNPISALWLLIFLILLQQFDEWILAPRIIGSKVGLSPLFVAVAVLVGGGVFGLAGMIVAIPITAVLKQIVGEFLDKRAKNLDIDYLSDSYR